MTKLLAIESSCDETAAAVIQNGRIILSNVVATQIELHRRFGGVYPELASRQHVLSIHPVIEQALDEAGITDIQTLDGIAVTHGPGLAGSLLVGVNAAKGMAFASGLPLLPINHLEGHIYSNWLDISSTADVQPEPEPELVEGEGGLRLRQAQATAQATGMAQAAGSTSTSPVADDDFPLLVLIVSGGHTELILMHGHGQYKRLGGTLDDAAGEAFDKIARLLNLGFPGGPVIQKSAEAGNATRFNLPRPLLNNPDHPFNFSFSGLKTAVLNLVKQLEKAGENLDDLQLKADLAASFQTAVTDVLVSKMADAAQLYKVRRVCICGGVSANAQLRSAAQRRFGELGIPLTIPPLFLCTDNAAMIGAAAHFRHLTQPDFAGNLAVDVFANLPISTSEEVNSEQ